MGGGGERGIGDEREEGKEAKWLAFLEDTFGELGEEDGLVWGGSGGGGEKAIEEFEFASAETGEGGGGGERIGESFEESGEDGGFGLSFIEGFWGAEGEEELEADIVAGVIGEGEDLGSESGMIFDERLGDTEGGGADFFLGIAEGNGESLWGNFS